MKRIRPGLAAFVAAALLGLTAMGMAAASPASATPPCFAYTCTGYDPISRGCAVTSTTSTADSLVTLWNRYSSGCRSNWARAQLSSAAVGAGYKLQIAIATKDSRGVNEYICYPGPSNTGLTYVACTSSYTGSSIIYGDMVDGTNLTQAFAEVFNSAGALIDIVEADQ